ncbi:ThuA-like domain-containing protein [Phialemonium atrogriseum]|uniref:ThuA-like domain-containing protein n=1 Tax=Phialemonium atrogriseum TaxID=1093897 RepID=A0AAJ0FJK4_9PEZI|nr:ThuA-like domain-containing protein [Phialemonium atrogriseum]KAK1763200.1 ThuA-like domain-containing protein [Phialemonium atrogriseum]
MSPTTPPQPSQPLQVLIFTKTSSYRHTSIEPAIAALTRLSATTQQPGTSHPTPISVTTSSSATIFTPSSLSRFSAILLLQNSGAFLTAPQLASLRAYVRAGGGVVGVHCAAAGMLAGEDPDPDPERWYGRLLGGAFAGHPEPQRGVVRVVDAGHGIVRGTVGKGEGRWWVEEGEGNGWRWEWFDEWYNFKENPRLAGDVHVLLSVDEGSYEGGEHGEDHPIAWCQEFEGGRSFYTALGHFDEAYEDEAFMGQLLNGILWVARII